MGAIEKEQINKQNEKKQQSNYRNRINLSVRLAIAKARVHGNTSPFRRFKCCSRTKYWENSCQSIYCGTTVVLYPPVLHTLSANEQSHSLSLSCVHTQKNDPLDGFFIENACEPNQRRDRNRLRNVRTAWYTIHSGSCSFVCCVCLHGL